MDRNVFIMVEKSILLLINYLIKVLFNKKLIFKTNYYGKTKLFVNIVMVLFDHFVIILYQVNIRI